MANPPVLMPGTCHQTVPHFLYLLPIVQEQESLGEEVYMSHNSIEPSKIRP